MNVGVMLSTLEYVQTGGVKSYVKDVLGVYFISLVKCIVLIVTRDFQKVR